MKCGMCRGEREVWTVECEARSVKCEVWSEICEMREV